MSSANGIAFSGLSAKVTKADLQPSWVITDVIFIPRGYKWLVRVKTTGTDKTYIDFGAFAPDTVYCTTRYWLGKRIADVLNLE